MEGERAGGVVLGRQMTVIGHIVLGTVNNSEDAVVGTILDSGKSALVRISRLYAEGRTVIGLAINALPELERTA